MLRHLSREKKIKQTKPKQKKQACSIYDVTTYQTGIGTNFHSQLFLFCSLVAHLFETKYPVHFLIKSKHCIYFSWSWIRTAVSLLVALNIL